MWNRWLTTFFFVVLFGIFWEKTVDVMGFVDLVGVDILKKNNKKCRLKGVKSYWKGWKVVCFESDYIHFYSIWLPTKASKAVTAKSNYSLSTCLKSNKYSGGILALVLLCCVVCDWVTCWILRTILPFISWVRYGRIERRVAAIWPWHACDDLCVHF